MVSLKTVFSRERLPWAIAGALAVHVCAVAAMAWGLPFLQSGKKGRGAPNCFCLEIVHESQDSRGEPRTEKFSKPVPAETGQVAPASQKIEEMPLKKPVAKSRAKPVPRAFVKLAKEGNRSQEQPHQGNGVAPFFNAPPCYPPAARRQKIQGTVRLKLLLDNSGRVAKIIALPPRVDPLLEEAAITAVRSWRFQSGEATIDVPVEFRLTK